MSAGRTRLTTSNFGYRQIDLINYYALQVELDQVHAKEVQ